MSYVLEVGVLLKFNIFPVPDVCKLVGQKILIFTFLSAVNDFFDNTFDWISKPATVLIISGPVEVIGSSDP